MSAWNPERYLRFRAERRQPYEDLVALVQPRQGMRVVDLGCGPGELTVDLARRLDAASVVGVDVNAAMLAKANELEARPVSFVLSDIASYEIGDVDLVFSNAALHWLPDHPQLFARLAAALGPGGQLAVQMPNNFAQPTHTIAVDLAGEAPFAAALGGVRIGAAVLPAEDYARLLKTLGFRTQIVREPIYLHELPSAAVVMEWIRGSMLTWYESRLGNLFENFAARYEARLLAALGDAEPYLFTYRRVLLWAERA